MDRGGKALQMIDCVVFAREGESSATAKKFVYVEFPKKCIALISEGWVIFRQIHVILR